ncbi:MAG: hypothetical protein IJX04_05365 [Oscillospiraceae bacterium]|nr:hypothetical protein [Oscillospiraceae bacterium]
MNAAQAEYKVKYHRSTHPCVMTLSFLLIAYVISRIAANYTIPQDEIWMVDCTIGMFVLGAGFFAIKWMHAVRFTAQEIVFYRLGMVYQRILWRDIVQVGIAKEYNADKHTLVLTPSACPKYGEQYNTTTQYVEKHRWKLILLDATKENQEAVRRFYGEIEYEPGPRK